MYAVTGTLLGPSQLSFYDTVYGPVLSEMMLRSFNRGVNGLQQVPPIDVFEKPTKENWIHTVLINEGRRGWVRAYGVRSGRKFARWLGTEARKLQYTK